MRTRLDNQGTKHMSIQPVDEEKAKKMGLNLPGPHPLTCVGEIILHEVHFLEGSLESFVEVSSLWECLVDNTNVGSKAVLDQVGDKVSADEADATKDQDCGLGCHLVLLSQREGREGEGGDDE